MSGSAVETRQFNGARAIQQLIIPAKTDVRLRVVDTDTNNIAVVGFTTWKVT